MAAKEVAEGLYQRGCAFAVTAVRLDRRQEYLDAITTYARAVGELSSGTHARAHSRARAHPLISMSILCSYE